MTALLETHKLGKAFGDFRALEDVNIAISAGELVCVIGPNGAGKTTLVNLLTGLLRPTSGDVLFNGKSIAGIGPVRLAEAGLARSFQLIQIFPQLTVRETIATALVSAGKKRWRMFSPLNSDKTITLRVRQIAEIFRLDRRLDLAAHTLAQGEKKLLDVASAFSLGPQLILLDEPTSGVSTADKRAVMDILIDAGRKAGVKGMLLVEHDMDLVATYATRIIALAEGRVLADLPAAQFFTDASLIAAVVGKRKGH